MHFKFLIVLITIMMLCSVAVCHPPEGFLSFNNNTRTYRLIGTTIPLEVPIPANTVTSTIVLAIVSKIHLNRSNLQPTVDLKRAFSHE
jgi:hypothetical protein